MVGSKLGITLGLAVLAMPASAAAATARYAAPTDQGTHDCSTPANVRAVNSAGPDPRTAIKKFRL